MTRQQMEATGYHAALLDVYHYLRRFGEPEDGEAYWNSAALTAVDIAERYKNTEISGFVNALLSATYDELKAARDRQKPAETADRKGGDISDHPADKGPTGPYERTNKESRSGEGGDQ